MGLTKCAVLKEEEPCLPVTEKKYKITPLRDIFIQIASLSTLLNKIKLLFFFFCIRGEFNKDVAIERSI